MNVFICICVVTFFETVTSASRTYGIPGAAPPRVKQSAKNPKTRGIGAAEADPSLSIPCCTCMQWFQGQCIPGQPPLQCPPPFVPLSGQAVLDTCVSPPNSPARACCIDPMANLQVPPPPAAPINIMPQRGGRQAAVDPNIQRLQAMNPALRGDNVKRTTEVSVASTFLTTVSQNQMIILIVLATLLFLSFVYNYVKAQNSEFKGALLLEDNEI